MGTVRPPQTRAVRGAGVGYLAHGRDSRSKRVSVAATIDVMGGKRSFEAAQRPYHLGDQQICKICNDAKEFEERQPSRQMKALAPRRCS